MDPLMVSSTPNTKHPSGRPTIYRAEMGDQIADAMATGLLLEAVAASSGVDELTHSPPGK